MAAYKRLHRNLYRKWSVVLGILVSFPGWAMEPEKLFSMLSPSIMVVYAYLPDGVLNYGSAVTIGHGKLLTNCHVLRKAQRIAIHHENVTYAARLDYADPERDLCQISAKNFEAPPVKIGNSDNLRVGQRVYALGNPERLELTLSDGLISSLRRDDNDKLLLIQTSAPISHGSSGGGLFDSEGSLIGITSLGVQSGQNLGFAIPINWFQDLPARSNALREKEAKKNAANESTSATGSTAQYRERQLTVEEMNRHFMTARSVHASTSRNADITFSTTPDGDVRFHNNNGSNVEGVGTFKVNEEDNQMCIVISSLKFKPAQGCYRLFQSGAKEYILRSTQDGYFIRYSIS